MNFYQNVIWKKISKDIFNKDIFDIELFGKRYWGVKKTHKKFGITMNWFQVLGITIPKDINENDFQKELEYIKTKFSKFNNIFFQFGFINRIEEPYFETRNQLEESFSQAYNLYPSIKENMPLATVVVDLEQSEEELLKNFSKSAKRNIRKAEKEGLYFKIADDKDIDRFYTLWEKTAKGKGFNIYPKYQYLKLLAFLKETGTGNLYLVKKDDIIISGSIEINDKTNSYYLYGATNRDYIKIGGHYFLKYEMFKYLKNKGINKVDLLGVAPMGYENHHLSGVSQFKHSLGGKHIEYFGNYDLPLNNTGYKLLTKLIKK